MALKSRIKELGEPGSAAIGVAFFEQKAASESAAKKRGWKNQPGRKGWVMFVFGGTKRISTETCPKAKVVLKQPGSSIRQMINNAKKRGWKNQPGRKGWVMFVFGGTKGISAETCPEAKVVLKQPGSSIRQMINTGVLTSFNLGALTSFLEDTAGMGLNFRQDMETGILEYLHRMHRHHQANRLVLDEGSTSFCKSVVKVHFTSLIKSLKEPNPGQHGLRVGKKPNEGLIITLTLQAYLNFKVGNSNVQVAAAADANTANDEAEQ